MDFYICWNRDLYVDGLEIINEYYAYIDYNGFINFSKNIFNGHEIDKFRNYGCKCIKLIESDPDNIAVYALFENGAIETLQAGDNFYTTSTLVMDEKIINMEFVVCGICTLSITGKVRINNILLLNDKNIINIKVFDDILFCYYLDGNINSHRISNLEYSNLGLTCQPHQIFDKMLIENKNNISSLWCDGYNILLLLLNTGNLIYSNECTECVEVNKTEHITIYKILANGLYRYISMFDFEFIGIIFSIFANNTTTNSFINDIISKNCRIKYPSIEEAKKEFYMTLDYKYVSETYNGFIFIMMDNSVKTFTSIENKIIEVFDIFEEYTPIYTKSAGCYI